MNNFFSLFMAAVILLFDSIYENNKENEDDKMKDIRHVEAIIAKQRNGRSGIANLIFQRQYSRFDMPSKEWEEQLAKINSRYGDY